MEEVHTIVNLVRKYYRDERRVCIITPYDGQRAALVAALTAAKLPHGNVYNVDSYQGALFSPHPLSPSMSRRSDRRISYIFTRTPKLETQKQGTKPRW